MYSSVVNATLVLMQCSCRVLRFFWVLLIVYGCFACPSAAVAQSWVSEEFARTGAQLTPSERAGRDIWFFATASSDRFYTYSYPQRLGAAIDWYKILAAKNRKDLFQGWGAIPDPDCCIPGDANCRAKTLDETFGFPWCPGDDKLLPFVGKEGYRDPGCDLPDATFQANTAHGGSDQRQSGCDLKFGTSTGALGLRKFPNPRFNAAKWVKLNGSPGNWDAYRSALSSDPANPDARKNRLFDGSVEPPFRIGMACGACHIAYDPLKAPADPNAPKWENIDGLVGNQYSRISLMLASGLSQNHLEWQLIARARPGTVDTSALPMDTVANPGTMNAIINLASRPKHLHRILKWHKASRCTDVPSRNCWCEPNKPGKCWERREETESVFNILKGGEDSIGAAEAVQRVYFNIGSCAEQCWLNHIPDLRAVDPAQRNYGQSPFDIGQCRRDCASFRAIEDRLGDVLNFLFTARPSDLWKARRLSSRQQLVTDLEREFGQGAVALGQQVFASQCASCHSSQKAPFDKTDFHASTPDDPTLRRDWLSSDSPIPVSRVGTYAGRALHSNHMPSRVWEEYASRTLHERPVDAGLKEIMKGNGRGYYRPPSLLSVWAHAPFMHNNAVGPELCGKPSNPEVDFYSSPYVGPDDKPLADPPACWPFDPSVEGRWKLFKASAGQLLNPATRGRKVHLLDRDLILDIAPKLELGAARAKPGLKPISTGLTIRVPRGTPALLVNSLRYKDVIQDLVLAHIAEDGAQRLESKYANILTVREFADLKEGLGRLYKQALAKLTHLQLDLGVDKDQLAFLQKYYSNTLGRVENGGHTFGDQLSDEQKRALIAFLATL